MAAESADSGFTHQQLYMALSTLPPKERSAITEFPDNDQFLDQLSAQLDKVEYLKRVQQEQKRRYRMNLVLAFVSGALGMLAALLLLPLLPSDMQIIESIIHLGHGITFPGNAKVLSTLMIVAISYGLIFSINSFSRDIREYRQSQQ